MTKAQIYVISSPSSERRSTVENTLGHSNLKWSYFDACTESSAGPDYQPELARRHRGRPLSGPEIGCFKSHWSLWKTIAASGGFAVIIEDDVLIDPLINLPEIISACEATGINYLRLHARQHRAAKVYGFMGARQLLRYLLPCYGTQAYLLNAAGAVSFLQAARVITRPVDDVMDRYWEHGLPPFCLFPFPTLEWSSASTIETSGAGRQISFKRKLLRIGEKFRRVTFNLRFVKTDRRIRQFISLHFGQYR